MLDEHVELLERVVIEQKLDALARGQLALGVLRRNAFLAAPEASAFAAGVEAGENVLHERLQMLELPRRGRGRPGHDGEVHFPRGFSMARHGPKSVGGAATAKFFAWGPTACCA